MSSFKYKYLLAKGLSKIAPPIIGQHRVLMYHSVPKIAERNDLYSVPISQFKEHILFLKEKGIKFISHEQSHKDKTEDTVSLTFDDGYADNLHEVAPFLVEHAIPFTVFVISSYVQNGENGFLSKADLRKLALLPGVTIGAHGKSHVPLAKIVQEEMLLELKESKGQLEEILGQKVDSMSFPHGSFNQNILIEAKKIGFKNCATSEWRSHSDKSDRLCRFPIFSLDSKHDVCAKALGKWDLLGKLM